MLEVILKWNKKAIGELAICNYLYESFEFLD
jgi:hypothetical protein